MSRFTSEQYDDYLAGRQAKDAANVKANREALQTGPKGGRTKRSRNREHDMQAACVKWFRYQYPDLSALLISVPNGAALRSGAVSWSYLQAEGATAGVADLLLLVPRAEFGYLALEMKTPKGRQRQTQKEWAESVRAGGGRYEVVRSSAGFERVVREYLGQKKLKQ